MKKKILFLPLMILLLLTLIITASCGNRMSSDETEPQVTAEQASSANETSVETPKTTTSGSINPEVSTPAPTTSTATTKETTQKTPVTTEPAPPAPPNGTRIRVKYEINNTYAGKIEGNKVQDVYYGKTSTETVSITTNLGYKFVGWSDGSTATVRNGDCPKQNTTYTAIFEFDALELPILELYTDSGLDITSKEVYVPGKISVHNAPEGFNFEDLTMEIRGRGNYTWGGAKKPYRIKLSEKMNLLGQGDGKAKSWVLLANHCDQSLLRNQTVMQFAKMLTGIVWEPSTSSVEVFLNGKYIGVYVLTEQVQINKNRIDLSEDITQTEIDFLCHYSNYARDPSKAEVMFEYDGRPYEIVSDLSTDSVLYNKQLHYIKNRIGECWDAVKAGNQEKILSLMDIDSVIDTLIVHEFFKNLDTGHDNFYMFASVDSKLHFGPVWDFDQCAGNANEGVENYEGIRGSNTQPWFSMLLSHDWFKEMILARWEELYEDEIHSVPAMIRNAARSGYNSYCRNFEKWQILGYTDSQGNKQLGAKINREMDHIRIFQTFDEHYEYFAQWMENRIIWLNNYYHSNEFIKQNIKLNLNGKGTQISPYLITSAEDFYNFTQLMSGGETFEGKYFLQTANIDMTKISFYTGSANPNIFAGVYDGGGHTINANIKSTESSFFPYVTGTIMNLVTTGSITNSGHTGGICRSVRVNGLIINCGSTVTISTSGNAGGVAPSNQGGGGSIIGCWFAGKIINASKVSPIVVYIDGRTYGTITGNYYIDSFCQMTTEVTPGTVAANESSISASTLSKLHTLLNQSLASNAKVANIDSSLLCSWTVDNDTPTLIAKN